MTETYWRARPEKKYCLFPISDRPYQNMCDPNLFYGFPKKKKKIFFFFFFFFRKSISSGMTVVKVTLKNITKRRVGSKSVKKKKNRYIMYR